MDCIEFLNLLEDNSVDACVTDPPYGLAFMGKKWDDLSSPSKMHAWHFRWAILLKQKMKPGSHLLAFSGTRTYHRLATAIEDAGFEIRDQIHWLYGSGFPKGKNLGDGLNTQLKPAHEPIVLARKPLSEKTITANFTKHGTGGMNIEACRITVSPEVDDMSRETSRQERDSPAWKYGSGFRNEKNYRTGVLPSGRYPANLILSHHPDCKLIQEGETKVSKLPQSHRTSPRMGKYGVYGKFAPESESTKDYDFDAGVPEIWECVEGCPIRILNEQSGDSGSHDVGFGVSTKTFGLLDDDSWQSKPTMTWRYGDSGGAARFFYCAKASTSERNKGLVERNPHVTIKPLKIMRWLIRLVTPKEGVVLDLFLGSGTTAIAAEQEGFDWLGCEVSEEYCTIARDRIEAWKDSQSKLEDFH